jgi:hypothetical protein
MGSCFLFCPFLTPSPSYSSLGAKESRENTNPPPREIFGGFVLFDPTFLGSFQTLVPNLCDKRVRMTGSKDLRGSASSATSTPIVFPSPLAPRPSLRPPPPPHLFSVSSPLPTATFVKLLHMAKLWGPSLVSLGASTTLKLLQPPKAQSPSCG